MPTPFESAQLNLQSFDLRREPVLRAARAWYIGEFNPETYEGFSSIISGERNTSFRMVVGYWDMAASLVTVSSPAPSMGLHSLPRTVRSWLLSARSSRFWRNCAPGSANPSFANTWRGW